MANHIRAIPKPCLTPFENPRGSDSQHSIVGEGTAMQTVLEMLI